MARKRARLQQLAGASAAAQTVRRARILVIDFVQMVVHLATLYRAPGARGRSGAAAAILSRPLAGQARILAFRRPV